MDASLERRLGHIEARLEALERSRDEVRPPAPEPLARPAATRPPPLPGRPAPEAAPRPPAPLRPVPASPAGPDWERFFGLAVLGRVGVGAVLVAAGYFAQLAWRGMGDVAKVASLYGLAGSFVATGWWLRERVARRYLALLWGGGAATAFLAGAAARLRYGLVGDGVGLVLLLGAAILGLVLARRLRHAAFGSLALAGAFAAPVLTASNLDAPFFLLAYLSVLHAGSAWMEERWRWRAARGVGIVGTLLVAGLWLARHGAMDTATYLVVHLYLLGLVAPELRRAWNGRALAGGRAELVPAALGAAEACLVLVTLGRLGGHGAALPLTALLSGALWTGLAIWLARRSGRPGPTTLVRGLARLGGLLLVVGALVGADALPVPTTGALHDQLALAGVLATAALALALRPRLGTGDLAASVAAALACATALLLRPEPTRTLALLPLAVSASALLLLAAQRHEARATAAWAGGLAAALGLACGWRIAADGTWLAAALAAGASWAGVVLLRARLRGDPRLAWHGTVQLLVLAGAWGLLAFAGPLRGVVRPLLDPTTVAAVCVAVVAGVSAWRARAGASTPSAARAVLWTLAVLLPLAAGERETLQAVRTLAPAASAGWRTLYLAGAAGVLAWLGRGRGPALSRASLGVACLALLELVFDPGGPTASPWAAAQLAAVLAALLAAAHLGPRRDVAAARLAFPALALASLGWAACAVAGRLPAATPFLDLRFALALLAVAAPRAFPFRRLAPADRRVARTTALLLGVALGLAAGLAELHDLVAPLPAAWPAVLPSVAITLYAAGLLLAGFLRADRRLRVCALVVFGGVVLKVGLHDLGTASTPLRIFVSGILGLVLLAAAFAYARRRVPDTRT
jgi:hypothetical protein